MDIIEGIDEVVYCPNAHPAHMECFKEWLAHSKSCPLCSTPYHQHIIDGQKDFIEEKEQAKIREYENQIVQEERQKIRKIAEKMVFLKFIEQIETLARQENYQDALERLDAYSDQDLSSYKGRDILFLRGKINLLRERYDLAINNLFKLVKAQFDYPDGFLYLGKAYEALGLEDKAKWAFDRANQ